MEEVAFDLNLRDEQRCGQMKRRSQAGQRRVVCAEGTAAAGSHLSDTRDPEHQLRNVQMGKAKLAEARVASEYQVEGVWTLSAQGLGARNAKLMLAGSKALCLGSDGTGQTGDH